MTINCWLSNLVSIPTRGSIPLSLCCLRLSNLEMLWALLNHRVCLLISMMPPVVLCDNQWWLLDILCIFTLLMHMHDGMCNAIFTEMMYSVLLFIFDGGFMTFWCRAEGIVIIFCARSLTHYHKLMISLMIHIIAPAPSVSPRTPLPALTNTMVVHSWEPPERLESPLPWLHQEINPFQDEPWDSPPVYETEPQSVLDQWIVTPGVPFQMKSIGMVREILLDKEVMLV